MTDRIIIAGRSTSGNPTGTPRKTRTARAIHYENSWEVHLGIGSPDTQRPAQAVIALTPEQATELANTLLALATKASHALSRTGHTP